MANVFETWPANGPLPINAFAVFAGTWLNLHANNFSVLVDDKPVEFIVSQHLSGKDIVFDQIALRPLVPPAIGGSWSVRFGNKIVGTFTAAAADHTPPAAPPASLHFDVHDFPNSSCSTCGGWGVNYWLHFGGGAEDGGAPLVHALYVGHPDAADDQLVAVRRVGPQPPYRTGLDESWFADDVAVTEGVCITLRLLDLAGNEAASALRTCKPCHASIDPMQEQCGGFPPQEEPAWTDADLFPGGACQAQSAPPLPPEGFPEPDPDTAGGTSDTGADPSTGDPVGDTSSGTTNTDQTTGDSTTTGTTGDPTAGETTSGSTAGETTGNTAATSTPDGETTPTTSGASMPGPTTAGPDLTTSDGSSGDSNDTATADPDKAICGCRGEPSSPAGLTLLLLAALRRRPRRRPGMNR